VMAPLDAFDAAYTMGITKALAQPRQIPRRERRGPARAAVSPAEPVALGGVVLTPHRQHKKGWVVISGDRIVAVTAKRPADAKIVATEGVILPGMIDLHGHPEYNVFAAWEPPKLYLNRQRWRDSDEYAAVVKHPWDRLTSGGASRSLKKTMTRYAEARALVGGVTAIQGASAAYPKQYEALVRNVDLWIFGQHIARSTVDVGRLTDDDINRLSAGLASGEIKAHYVHLAEGKRGNQAALSEYKQFVSSGLLSGATVVIHGTALATEHFGDLHDAGAKLVWSPQSNLRLYGETTDMAAVLDVGLPVALGADWMPSGSRSLLDEMRVARRSLAEQGVEAPAAHLVRMVTTTAAHIAGLDNELGSLAARRPADVVVVERRDEDGFESVLGADPSAVQLVIIGGDVVYMRADWAADLGVDATGYENVAAWGRPMLLDTRFGSPDTPDDTPTVPARRLVEMRRRLIARYPNVGPIFA
jgi:5-methylthioadenosine/S-adenosylhomocysteine deaminase